MGCVWVWGGRCAICRMDSVQQDPQGLDPAIPTLIHLLEELSSFRREEVARGPSCPWPAGQRSGGSGLAWLAGARVPPPP